MRAEQAAAAAAAVEQRKAELRGFVDEFQTSVGGILDKVLSSSGEFERVARSSPRPRAAPPICPGQSASASETASEHVRTAAAASDELSSSIAEITRRVQESNGIAADAVKQADGHRPAHQRAVAGRRAHRRRRQADHVHCRADQSPGAQRHHRGRARRRCRPRLCRGGPGGQEPRRPDRQGDRRDLQPDRQHAACDRRVGRRDQGDRPDHRAHQRHRHLDLGRGRATACVRRRTSPKAFAPPPAAPPTSPSTVRNAARGADETGETSSRMFASAQALSSESLHLKAEVERFLDRVRAA